MFSNYLVPTCCFDEQHIIDYNFVRVKSCVCSACESQCNVSYTTYIVSDKICIKTCYLCHIVMNFKKYHSNKIFLIKSKMNQSEIIKKILDNYNNYRQILNPIDVDKSCKLVKNLNLNDYFENPNNFPDVKIYFNPNVLSHLVDLTQNMFCKQKFEDDTTLSNYSYVTDFYNDLNKLKTHNVNNVKTIKLHNDIKNSDKSFDIKQKNVQIIMKIKKECASHIAN